MSARSLKKPMATAQTQGHEDVKEAILLAVPGEKRSSKNNLKNGFRVWSDSKQIASAYFDGNAPGNQVEFALNFRLFEKDARMHATARHWFDLRKIHLGDREVNVHQRGIPVDWFRIGFESVEQSLEFLEQLRFEHRKFDKAGRWRIEEKPVADTATVPSEPEIDVPADGEPEDLATPNSEWRQTVIRMVVTAGHTIIQSNGEPSLKSVKVKQSGFCSLVDFERYVSALIETQSGRCAISGLTIQRDEACKDSEMLASLDRIDSGGHYAAGNLQVVCRFINRWKGADDNALFLRLLSELRQGHTHGIQ